MSSFVTDIMQSGYGPRFYGYKPTSTSLKNRPASTAVLVRNTKKDNDLTQNLPRRVLEALCETNSFGIDGSQMVKGESTSEERNLLLSKAKQRVENNHCKVLDKRKIDDRMVSITGYDLLSLVSKVDETGSNAEAERKAFLEHPSVDWELSIATYFSVQMFEATLVLASSRSPVALVFVAADDLGTSMSRAWLSPVGDLGQTRETKNGTEITGVGDASVSLSIEPTPYTSGAAGAKLTYGQRLHMALVWLDMLLLRRVCNVPVIDDVVYMPTFIKGLATAMLWDDNYRKIAQPMGPVLEDNSKITDPAMRSKIVRSALSGIDLDTLYRLFTDKYGGAVFRFPMEGDSAETKTMARDKPFLAARHPITGTKKEKMPVVRPDGTTEQLALHFIKHMPRLALRLKPLALCGYGGPRSVQRPVEDVRPATVLDLGDTDDWLIQAAAVVKQDFDNVKNQGIVCATMEPLVRFDAKWGTRELEPVAPSHKLAGVAIFHAGVPPSQQQQAEEPLQLDEKEQVLAAGMSARMAIEDDDEDKPALEPEPASSSSSSAEAAAAAGDSSDLAVRVAELPPDAVDALYRGLDAKMQGDQRAADQAVLDMAAAMNEAEAEADAPPRKRKRDTSKAPVSRRKRRRLDDEDEEVAEEEEEE